jgi:hypothetical protein
MSASSKNPGAKADSAYVNYGFFHGRFHCNVSGYSRFNVPEQIGRAFK